MATNDQSSNDDCLIFDVMPKTVAIAPGLNMSGIASGNQATVPDATPPQRILLLAGRRRRKKLKADLHQNDAAHDTDHAERNTENPQQQCPENQKKETQAHRVEARLQCHRAVRWHVRSGQELQV